MIETVTQEGSPRSGLRENPYVGLRPYTEAKARFFFGRTREIDLLTANLRASRLTLVYGPSGVGKSSLLQAGVVPYVRGLLDLTALAGGSSKALSDGRVRFAVSMVNQWTEDPLRTMMNGIGSSVRDSADESRVEDWDPAGTAVDLALSWTKRVRTLLVILDQFEEYFQYHAGDDGPGTFAVEWPQLVNHPKLRVNFLVSIREDSWSRLDVFKERIPHLYGNYLRVDHLDRTAATEAITGPVEQLNGQLSPGETPFSIQGELVREVLLEVPVGRLALVQSDGEAISKEKAPSDSERIEAPFLQLVMDRLWKETIASGASDLRLETLTKLGGAQQIVRSHLAEALAGLTDPERETAASVLRYLVSRSKTKVAHRASDLAEWAERPGDEVATVLEKLTREQGGRLLRPVAAAIDEDPAPRYEILHDLLGEAILEWIQTFRQERERDEVREREKAKQRESLNRVIRWSALLLALLVAALAITSVYALSKARLAGNLATTQRSQALAARALAELEADPELSVAIARTAVETSRTSAAVAALRVALGASRVRATFAAKQPLEAVAIDPSGQWIGAAGDDGDVVVWNSTTRRLESELPGKGTIGSLQFSPDGSGRVLMVGAGTNLQLFPGPARVWRVDSNEARQLVDPSSWTPQNFVSARFSPNGRFIVTGSFRGAAVWNAMSGNKPLRVLPFPASTGGRWEVDGVSFDPSGQLIVAGAADGAVKVWRWRTRETVLARTVAAPRGSTLIGVAFSPVGHLVLATDGSGATWVWNLRTGRLQAKLPGFPHSTGPASFSPDGKRVLAWGDKEAVVWDAGTGDRLSEFVGHTDWINAAAFSPDGTIVATGSRDGTARVWDTSTGHELISLNGHHGGVNAVVFDGRSRLITASDDETVRIWDLAPPAFNLEGQRDWILSAAFSPDGKRVATASADGTARLWDLHRGTPWKPLGRSTGSLDSVAFSQRGDQLVTSGTGIDVYDVESSSPRHLYRWELKDEVLDAEFSPDGKAIVTAGLDGETDIWNWDGQRASKRCVVERRRLGSTSATFTPDGDFVLTTSWSGGVHLLAVGGCGSEPTPPVRTFGNGLGALWAASFAPTLKESNLVVTAGADDTARIWDWRTGALVKTLVGHTSWVSSAAFSPDGTKIVTGGADRSTRIWDATSGAQLAVIYEHADSVNDVAFSPDGKWILSASDDRTVKIYACDTCGSVSQLLRLAAKRITRPITPDEQRAFVK